MKSITLTHEETVLLEHVIQFYYFAYAKPPFKDIEDRFTVGMDPNYDVTQAAERQAECYTQEARNDLLAELGAKDDPQDPKYVSQIKRAEFYTVQSFVHRWYNGLQYAYYNRLMNCGNHEAALKAYQAREDRAGITVTFESLTEGSSQLHVENNLLDDTRAMVHFVCEYMQNITHDSLAQWIFDRYMIERAGEDKVSTVESVQFQEEARKNLAAFNVAYESLVAKLLLIYRDTKYKTLTQMRR